MVKSFILQLQFLTRIPVPVTLQFDETKFVRGIIYASVVGGMLGGLTAGVFFLTGLTAKPLLASLCAITALTALTGGLHLDGLADTFDGIFSGRPREKILEIMKDSRIGTNGAIVVFLVLLFKVVLCYSLPAQTIISYLIVMPVLSRMNIAWTAGMAPYARDEKGMGSFLVDSTGKREIVLTTLIGLLVSFVFLQLLGAVLLVIAVFFGILFTRYIQKRIGGVTGDTIGALIELSEVVYLFSLVVLESVGLPGYLNKIFGSWVMFITG